MKKFYLVLILLFLTMPLITSADVFGTCNTDNPKSPNSSVAELCNPTNNGSVQQFVENTMIYAGSIIGLIAIATLVYAGVRLLFANGNESTIGEAKQTILYTILGFIISVFAYAGIVAIENFIGVKELDNQLNQPFNPFSSTTLQGFVENLLKRTLELAGLVGIFMVILNGFKYMSARGDDKRVSSAKSGITWSIVGLAVILFAYVIINAVARLIS